MGSPYFRKKIFMQSFDIMKHSAKYELCGNIQSASTRYSLFCYRGIRPHTLVMTEQRISFWRKFISMMKQITEK